jgi:hypothetical protein
VKLLTDVSHGLGSISHIFDEIVEEGCGLRQLIGNPSNRQGTTCDSKYFRHVAPRLSQAVQ